MLRLYRFTSNIYKYTYYDTRFHSPVALDSCFFEFIPEAEMNKKEPNSLFIDEVLLR